jgi:hypothetical protein
VIRITPASASFLFPHPGVVAAKSAGMTSSPWMAAWVRSRWSGKRHCSCIGCGRARASRRRPSRGKIDVQVTAGCATADLQDAKGLMKALG